MENSIFKTTDLGLAAALVTVGFELVGLDKTNPKKTEFIFKAVSGDILMKDIEDDANKYWGDKLLVSALEYYNNSRMLKNRIHSS